MTDVRDLGIVGIAGDIIENASTLPADLRELADQLNREYINIAESVNQQKEETAAQVEENLRQNEIQRIWGDALEWLQEPTNLFLTAVGFIAFVIFVRKV